MAGTTYEFRMSRSVINQIDPVQQDPNSSPPPPFNPNRPFDYLDRSLSILGYGQERQETEIKGITTIMDARFDIVDRQFKEVKEEVKEVREEVKEVREEVKEVKARLDNSEARAHNMRAINGWSNIYPVGITHQLENGTWEFQKPKDFPDKVLKFWHLQRRQDLPTLISLSKFYGIPARELRIEGVDPDDEDSDLVSVESEVPISSQSFEEVVKKNPSMQLEMLAEHLGLDLVAIRNRMVTEDRVGELQAMLAVQKRSREEDIEEGVGPRKKVLVGRTPLQPPQQPPEEEQPLAGMMINGVFVPRRLLPSKVSESKLSSEQDVLGWGNESPLRRRLTRQQDTAQEKASPSGASLPSRSIESPKEMPETPTQRILTADHPARSQILAARAQPDPPKPPSTPSQKKRK
jgi:hypothetical protein